MPKYRSKSFHIEAVNFNELVHHGITHGGNIVRGMPWSFNYAGHPVTYENDQCYLIPTLEGTMIANNGDWIIRGVKGELYPCKPDIFAATYEPA